MSRKRTVRTDVICHFPGPQKRDLHPMDEDLSVGTPDLGHPELWGLKQRTRRQQQILRPADPILCVAQNGAPDTRVLRMTLLSMVDGRGRKGVSRHEDRASWLVVFPGLRMETLRLRSEQASGHPEL